MNNICVIYGGNSKLINSLKNDLLELFGSIILISREQVTDNSKNIKSLKYNEISDIEKQLKKYIKNSKVFYISAAAFSSDKLFLNENYDSLNTSIQVNLTNNIKLIQILMSESIKHRNGTFVFISSFRADVPTKGTCIYSSSKKFVETLFSSLAIEYSVFNQRFLTIKIGLFESGLSTNLPFDIKSKKFLKSNLSTRRVSTSKDIFSAIKFIYENEYINGTEIDMTGKLLLDLKL